MWDYIFVDMVFKSLDHIYTLIIYKLQGCYLSLRARHGQRKVGCALVCLGHPWSVAFELSLEAVTGCLMKCIDHS